MLFAGVVLNPEPLIVTVDPSVPFNGENDVIAGITDVALSGIDTGDPEAL